MLKNIISKTGSIVKYQPDLLAAGIEIKTLGHFFQFYIGSTTSSSNIDQLARNTSRIKDGNFAFENNLVARVESLFRGLPSNKGIQILEDAEIVAINAAALFQLYDNFPDIERLARKITEAAYVESVNRLESIQFHSADERYKALLEEDPNILQRVPLKYIASYLGITQVSLSRIRGAR